MTRRRKLWQGSSSGRSAPAVDMADIRVVSVADLPSRFGSFRAVAFTTGPDGKEHMAMVHGQVRDASDIPLRIHSECLTGDVLGSLRCDCRDQLTAALEWIGSQPAGIVLYLRQEGRGIGLTNKIRAYALQDRGYDTIEANRMLGFGDDLRDYGVAAEMLSALGVKSVRLMTNNPAKLSGLREHGIRVTGRVPLVLPPNQHNIHYLRTKQKRAGHWLGVGDVAAESREERPASEPSGSETPVELQSLRARPIRTRVDEGSETMRRRKPTPFARLARLELRPKPA